MPAWVLLGALAGIVCGVAIGQRAAVLGPLGSAYAMMLQIAVYPYLMCALIYGLGRLTPATAGRLLRAGWHVYLFLWVLTLASIWLLAQVIPTTLTPIVLDAEAARGESEFLKLLIPSNVINDVARNYVPAIVVFAIVYGIAIQKIERKSALFEILDAMQAASVTLWSWVVRFAPIGVFALFADAAGTIAPARLSGLLLYVGLFMAGTLVLAFIVLPAVLVAVAPISHRAILKELQPALVIAVVTTLSVVALPYIQRAAERLADAAGCPDSAERDDVIKAVVALSYVLAQLGNYFLYLLILYAAFAYQVELTGSEQVLLPLWTLLSGLGSPSAIVDGVIFIGHWLRLPQGLVDLFIETWTVTRYGQVVLSVTGFAFATMLIPLIYFGKARWQPRRALLSAGATALSLGAAVAAGIALRAVLLPAPDAELRSLTIDPRLTAGLDVAVLRHAEPSKAPAASGPPTLLTIRESGVLRVGYNPQAPPFSYFNAQGDLVGFDISLAYQLARDLGVRLEFVPFDWQTLERYLREHRFDVAMSGIYETDDRLQAVAVTHPYFQSPIALIVRSDQASRFVDRQRIKAIPNLRLAVRGDPVLTPMVHFLFPNAVVTVVPRDAVEEALASGRVDGVVSSLIEARLWAAAHPGFTAVAPTAARGPILFTYLVPPGGDSFRRYLDQWLDIKSSDGFRSAQVDYWMNQTPRADSPRRWNLIDAR